MNTSPLRWMPTLAVALFFAALAPSRAQGDLTPPGAPAPVMRTLEQLEPRTPITNLPFNITQPGSYYITTNLVSDRDGIVVQTNRVTIDLMGFSLVGNHTNNNFGIWLASLSAPPLRDIAIHNGTIVGFSSGIWAYNVQNCRMENLQISSNSQNGIVLDGISGRCDRNVVSYCTVGQNGAHGILLYGITSGRCNGNQILDCVVSGNIADGIRLYGSSSGRCNGNLVARCTLVGNGSQGIRLLGGTSGQCNGNRIAACSISANGSYGISADATGGRCEGNVVEGCTLRQNGTRGIDLSYANGNRIEDNQVSGSVSAGGGTFGISSTSSTNNLVVRNFCAGQTNNYSLGANNTYGPSVTTSGELAGGAAAHPWANFSR